MEPRVISLAVRRDLRGILVPVEAERDVPFPIRRVYYLWGVPSGVRRGGHAHRTNRQLAIAVAGTCRFLLDDGHTQAEVLLDSPTRGLLIEPWIWHEMYDFSADCVLVMLASGYFDEADYIRTYGELQEVRR